MSRPPPRRAQAPHAIRAAHTQAQQHAAFHLIGVCAVCAVKATDPIFVAGAVAGALHTAYCRSHAPESAKPVVAPQSHICPHCSRPAAVTGQNPVLHPITCPAGPVKCPRCESIFTRSTISAHHDICQGPVQKCQVCTEPNPHKTAHSCDVYRATCALKKLSPTDLQAFLAQHPSP